MKRLCIIPAREGSKRIPLKNIKEFHGKPMIAHAIQIAQKAGIFDEIHVSTDSEKIAQLSIEAGASVDFLRPKELADDHTPLMSVLKNVVETYQEKGKVFDTITLLYTTSPLADPIDLKKACQDFESVKSDRALLSIVPFPTPIEKSFLCQRNNDLSPTDEALFKKRSQDLKESYYDAGMFCFYTPDYVLNSSGAGNYNGFRGYVVPSYRVTDIDTVDDWDRAEKIYKAIIE
jgi:N-acylneuraminate cytidylyltransferase